jgi:hypothetical protein
MTGSSRLSICYVAPGRDLRPGTSHTRHVLGLARALAGDADVTVVFRRVLGAIGKQPFEVRALEDATEVSGPDAAPSWRLGQLAERGAGAFGVILEGSSPSAGRLTSWCAQRGVPAIPVIDHLPGTSWLAPLDAGRDWLALGSSGRYLRRMPVMVAGSDALRTAIVNRWRVQADRVAVIGPAVDRALFAPRDQAEARRRLGLAADHRIILAGDGLGSGPDLTPLIEAVQRVGDSNLRLHVLGDGGRRAALERLAGRGGAVTFHGHVPDDLVAAYIAAADLCVSVDERGDSAFTVRECLSAGRPVAIGGDRSHTLVRHLVSGFLVDHDLLAWIRFFQRDCPSRNTLRFMGVAATATPLDGVDRTAAAYLEAIERVRRNAPRPAAAR